jgi:hypothetical protein
MIHDSLIMLMYINANVCIVLITILNKKKYKVGERFIILHRKIMPNCKRNE